MSRFVFEVCPPSSSAAFVLAAVDAVRYFVRKAFFWTAGANHSLENNRDCQPNRQVFRIQ